MKKPFKLDIIDRFKKNDIELIKIIILHNKNSN